MTVTKQQQLEWLAKNHNFTNQHVKYVAMSASEIGLIIGSGTSCNAGFSINCHVITRQEWQHERDKMSSKPEVDNSWHERGELPPVGCECEIKHNWWSEFHRVTVAAITKEYAIVEDDSVVAREQHYHLRDITFRPLRTERERAIDALIDIILAGCYFTSRDGAASKIAERIYDAWMLK